MTALAQETSWRQRITELRAQLDEMAAELERLRQQAVRAVSGPERIERDGVTLDVTRHEAQSGGAAAVALTPSEVKLLALLLAAPGRIFSRGELLQTLGYRPDITGRLVDAHVNRLRTKLGQERRHLQSIWGGGYTWR